MGNTAATTSLYLTGGRQKPRQLDEWNAYDRAVILHWDAPTGAITTAVEYVSPPESYAGGEASITFKAATIAGDRLYVVTNTEVVIYEPPAFRQVGYLSLPWFNDMHYACPARNGNLLIVSTGLDMVGEVTARGETVREWSVIETGIWERFSPQTDYRKVATTKPHSAHPNFVIESGEDLWVSRCNRDDVYCLTRPGRIQFCGHPHDGVRHEGKLYFTTVNGYIHVLDEKHMTIEETIDLNQIDTREVALGWMRGILPMGELCWVGFTRLRPTKFHENLSWVRHGFKQFYLPTRIALYDLKGRQLVREIDIEPYGIHAVYSILPAR
jgi:outer membrane protein assembly factor BamB